MAIEDPHESSISVVGSPTDPDLIATFQSRVHALKNAIQSLADKIDSNKEVSGFNRGKTLFNLTISLKKFLFSEEELGSPVSERDLSSGVLEYYLYGFHSRILKRDDSYPPEYILSALLRQGIDDLEVLHNCFYYRFTEIGSYRQALEEFDRQAHLALQPAITCRLVREEITVLTYYQKGLSIRQLPYADVMLIGLSLTNTYDEMRSELLALPHEVGHQVFWHAKLMPAILELVKKEINEAYYRRIAPFTGYPPDIPPSLVADNKQTDHLAHLSIAKSLEGPIRPYYTYWLEEIFADVYGCLIGGPELARAVQGILVDGTPEMFIADDGVHPSPILRPSIYIETLRVIRDKAAKLLRDNKPTCFDDAKIEALDKLINELERNWYGHWDNEVFKLGWVHVRLKSLHSIADPSKPITLQSLTLEFYYGEVAPFVTAIEDVKRCVLACILKLEEKKVLDVMGFTALTSDKKFGSNGWQTFFGETRNIRTITKPIVNELDIQYNYIKSSPQAFAMKKEKKLAEIGSAYFNDLDWATYGPGPANVAPTFK